MYEAGWPTRKPGNHLGRGTVSLFLRLDQGPSEQSYCDSSSTSMPETVALFAIGSKVMLSLPCGLGFRW